MASTNAGLCQGNMTWCLKVRGDKYHWVIDLYDRLNLPVIPAITEALIKCVRNRADELAKQQTEARKQQRIKMKVARSEDQEARKKWVKQQAVRHTYGGDSEDDGDDDGQLVAEVNDMIGNGEELLVVSFSHDHSFLVHFCSVTLEYCCQKGHITFNICYQNLFCRELVIFVMLTK